MTALERSLEDQFFERVLATVSAGVVFLEAEGTIVFANRHAAALVGETPEGLRGRSFDELLPGYTLETLLEAAGPDARDELDCVLAHDAGHTVPVVLTDEAVDRSKTDYRLLTFREAATGPDRSRTFLRGEAAVDAAADPGGGPRPGATAFDADVSANHLETLRAVSDRLSRAETRSAAARMAVDFVQTMRSQAYVAVWEVESEGERLDTLAVRTPITTADDAPSAFPPIGPETVEMELFEARQTDLLTDYHACECPAHPGFGIASRLVLSLGEHGLLTVDVVTDELLTAPLQNLFGVVAAVVRATFDRLAVEATSRYRSTAMEAVTDGIGITDEVGEFQYVNPAFAELYGYADPAALRGTSWRRLYPSEEVKRFDREVFPLVEERRYWRGEVVGERADGSRFFQEHSLASFNDHTVCIVRDITRRKEREHRLESLNEVTRELIRAETGEEITQIGIEAVRDVFGFDLACIRLFDDATNRLEWADLTDDARTLLETEIAYDLEATLAGRAFRSGETVVDERIENDPPPSVADRSSVHVPIGAYGVLSVLVHDDETIETNVVALTELLSMGIEAALVQADRIRLLRAHEQQLGQAEALRRIDTLTDEIADRLLTATTPGELTRTVCERLTASELYRRAWIGHFEGEATTLEASSSDDAGHRPAPNHPLSKVVDALVERTLETATTQICHRYQTAVCDPDWDEFDEEAETIAAVPIVVGERITGALVVTSTRSEAFDERVIGGFEVLGRLIGTAANALAAKEVLLSGTVVELEIDVEDPTAFPVQLTTELACRCELQRAIPEANGHAVIDYAISGAEPATVLAIAEDASALESAHIASERDERFVVRTVSRRSVVQLAADLGMAVRSSVAEGGTETVVLDAASTAAVSELVATLEREFDPLELAAKRDRDHAATAGEAFRASVADRLTEKQHSALYAAYRGGYYDWPRDVTAEELAESMGVAPATLHQHLRKGNRYLLATFFSESS